MTLRRALLWAAVLLAIAHCYWFSDFTVDDGAISFSYARSLAEGHGLVLVPGGERVEGYTNFLWVLLLSIGIKLGGDPFRLSHLYGGALSALAVLGAAALMAALRGRRSAWDALPAALVAALPPVAYWAMSGLEGGLYTALVVWCAARLALEQKDPSRAPLSALLAAGCALTRPDGLAILACAALIRLTYDRSTSLLGWLALAITPVAAHVAWRYSYYAYPLPNTFYAKVQEPFRVRELLNGRAVGWRYIRDFFSRYQLLALLLPAALALWPRRGLVARTSTVLFVPALLFFPIYARGDWMSEGRFLVAVLPLLAVLACVGLDQLIQLAPERARGWAWAGAAIGLVALVVPNAVKHSRERHGNYPVPAAHVAKRGLHYRELAERYHMQDPSALDGDLGGTSYYAAMNIVDLGMLADVTLAHHRASPSILREYIHGERRPSFMRLAGFWLEHGIQTYPEFADRYVPSGMPDITVDRRAFVEEAIDPRTPIAQFPAAGVDLLGARVRERVELWLLVRPGPPADKLTLRGDGDSLEVRHEILGRERWRPGEILHLELRRPKGAARICEADRCVALTEGENGAQPKARSRPQPASLERASIRDELELALAIARRLGAPTAALGARLYARGKSLLATGDTARAFRDLSAALRADPSLAFARRYVEELRLAPRHPYRYRDEARLERAVLSFHLEPTEASYGTVILLSRAAERPEAAEAVFLATGLRPTDPSTRLALFESLLQAGNVEGAAALFPTPPTVFARAGVAEPPAGAAIAVATGISLVHSWARLTRSGRVELSLALRGRGATGLRIAGRDSPFDRRSTTWDESELYVHAVELDLPAGRSTIEVGSAHVEIEVDPFTQDFERGSFEGWTASGEAFAKGPLGPRPGSPLRGYEGMFSISSSGAARGELRSGPLAPGVDEVCFVLAGGASHAGVRFDPPSTTASGQNDDLLRETCLSAPPAGARIVVFDEGAAASERVAFDDLACYASGRPVACAGAARITKTTP